MRDRKGRSDGGRRQKDKGTRGSRDVAVKCGLEEEVEDGVVGFGVERRLRGGGRGTRCGSRGGRRAGRRDKSVERSGSRHGR